MTCYTYKTRLNRGWGPKLRIETECTMKRFTRQGLAALLSSLLVCQLFPTALAGSPDVSITEDVFPDAIFRQWLTDPANLDGAGSDGVFTQEELESIRQINVSSMGISSLEGIEVFSALESLNCKDNVLEALNVQQNRALRYLQCDYNRIDSLDVSGLDQLKALYCQNNHMTSLDLTDCTALEIIYCRSNDLESVDFSTNTSLKFIESFDNQLTKVDLSMLTELEFAHLDHNRLTHLDMSHNPNLSGIGSGFVARNNWLETLVLPDRPGQEVDWEVYLEQNAQPGHERVEWYYDPLYTQPVEELTPADGRTLYAKWLPNDYTIRFDAGGGSGSMASLDAVWDVPVTLPAQNFRRTGYTFDAWESSISGARYADGAQVTNLAGRRQGDKVTLYAKWTPITYNVAFDAGSGSGTMSPRTYTYGQEKALPRCTLTAPAGLEFVGWARKSGGAVVFRDEDPVWNLASTQDETVTLYAVWGTPILNQYMDRLDAIYDQYDPADYTTQDWNSMERIYADAAQALFSAGGKEDMERICADAKTKLSGVADVAVRAEAVLNLWREDHQSILALVDAGAVLESNAQELWTAARGADEALRADFVADRTDLTLSADQTLVAQTARSAAQAQLSGLSCLADAAAWAKALGGLSLRPMTEVTSQTVSAYQNAVTESSAYAPQLHRDLTGGLEARAALALCKQQSTQALLTAYQGYDLSKYSQQGQAQLESIQRQAAAAMEAAASESRVTSLLDTALKDLQAVPVQTPDPQPGGGGGGGGGGAPEEPVTPPESKPQEPAWVNPYTDVSQDAWYYASVEYVSSNGIMNGYADGTFRPGQRLSRAHLAQLLYNLEGRPQVSAARYTDTEEGAWYESAISWATDAGILTGYADGSIRPNALITRQQLAAMLYRYARYTGRDVSLRADLDGYADAAQISPYALEAMQWANAAGIINGSGDALLPGSTATRAQTAAMLNRFCTGEA